MDGLVLDESVNTTTLRKLSATQEQIADTLASLANAHTSVAMPTVRSQTASEETVNSRKNYLCRGGCHRSTGVDKRLIALIGQAVICFALMTMSIIQIALGSDNREVYYAIISYVIGLYSPSSKRVKE